MKMPPDSVKGLAVAGQTDTVRTLRLNIKIIIKALRALVVRLSLSEGWENGLERGLDCFI